MNSEARQFRDMRAHAVRHFLLLQMPCGQFGRKLQRAVKSAGHRCTKIAINGGDLMGSLRDRTVAYTRSFADWPSWIAAFARSNGVTDVICYGDCRPYHSAAIQALKPLGVRIHVLEEGYLRPNWVTCERDGVNGHSVLTGIDLDRVPAQPVAPPETMLKASNFRYWAAGFNYYLWTTLLTPMFPRYQTHRDLDTVGEATLWLQRIFSWPFRRSRTERALKAIDRLQQPVHLILLQLNGDSQIKVHSGFRSTRHFVEYCIAEFAASGAQDALLVFKNHPLDSGVIDLNRVIREETERHGLEGRVFFVETGKLVPLLDKSISATAINSTACHQALLRGIPTLVLGKAVFNHPQIVSRMRLADFFRLRPCKNRANYDKLVSLMRQTCQFNGGFYTEEGRRILLPTLVRALVEGMPDVRSLETPAETVSEVTAKRAS
jgi:capsular polysaccharide export protein